MTAENEAQENQLKKQLTPTQYQVLRQKQTEPPGSGRHLHERRTGTYTCAGCGQKLFLSDDKYDAGCGWPSYTKPVKNATKGKMDIRHGTVRREVTCRNCGGHLGHVFPDGPLPRMTRYCINSAALEFVPKAPRKS